MDIRVVSDLHLEHWRRYDHFSIEQRGTYFVPHTDRDKNAVLVIAGDLVPATRIEQTDIELIGELARRFREIIYVMGNHDHYHGWINNSKAILEEAIAANGITNFTVLDNQTRMIDDVGFVGTTLWTDFDRGSALKTALINDFVGLIKIDRFDDQGPMVTENYSTQHALAKFHENIDFLTNEVKRLKTDPAVKTAVVVTHHAPSLRSIDVKYLAPPNNKINPAFASDLDDLIIELAPMLWIHGHVHDNFDYIVGTTNVVCNPFGYPHERGRNRFVDKLIKTV